MSHSNSLFCISPIDGRYTSKTQHLSQFFSEYALIKTRVEIEIEYLIALAGVGIKGLNSFSKEDETKLRTIYIAFNEEDANEVKRLESTINHDVKAVEYFIKNKCTTQNIQFNMEFVHFGLTSQDINNTSFPLMFKRYVEQIYIPNIKKLRDKIDSKSNNWKSIPLLAKTHGQPASPTTLGKEFKVFSERISHQLLLLHSVAKSAFLLIE